MVSSMCEGEVCEFPLISSVSLFRRLGMGGYIRRQFSQCEFERIFHLSWGCFRIYLTYTLISHFHSQLATRSIEPSFGLLFGDLLKDLDVGTTGAAIIISALDVMMNFSGLFVGPLLKEFSYRKVALAGSLLCALGLALTSPATSMAHILATYSVINGNYDWFLY